MQTVAGTSWSPFGIETTLSVLPSAIAAVHSKANISARNKAMNFFIIESSFPSYHTYVCRKSILFIP